MEQAQDRTSMKGDLARQEQSMHDDRVSRRIRAIRTQKGINQADVAKQLDLKPSNYNRMEKRGEKMTVEQLDRIAAVLGVTAASLLADDPIEVSAAAQENHQLRQRVSELEQWLHDKHRINNFYREAVESLQRQIYQLFLGLAIRLKLSEQEDQLPDMLTFLDVWGQEQIDENGEKVLAYGIPPMTVKVSDLDTIIDHMARSMPDLYTLFLAASRFLESDSSISKTLLERSYKAYPELHPERFFERMKEAKK